jgi:hypothetical protein
MLIGVGRCSSHGMRRKIPSWVWLIAPIAVLFIVLSPRKAAAYSWMIKHRYGGCATCHADPSGGELLTRYGRAQGDLLLRMRYGDDTISGQGSDAGEASDFESFESFDSFDNLEDESRKDQTTEAPKSEEPTGPSKTSGFLWGLFEPPDALLLGGSYRHLTIIEPSAADPFDTFPMQADLYGQLSVGPLRLNASIGVAKVDIGSPHARAAQVTANQGDELNLISRVHWLAYDLSPVVTLRAGRMNLPFGVRIPEHVMWVREATRTDRESDQQHGLAAAFTTPRTRGEIMVVLGNFQISPDRFRERGYSLYFEGQLAENSTFGISSMFTMVDQDRVTLEEEPVVRHAHGAFGRLTLAEPLVALVEVDALLRSRRDTGYVGFLQLDYEATQGLHLMFTGEVLDEGFELSAVTGRRVDRTSGFGLPRFGAWLGVDWFFMPHFEARVEAVARQNDELQFLAQLHVYL